MGKRMKKRVEKRISIGDDNMLGKHISIEGFDGVGKSTVCKIISEKLGFKFIEKPLQYLFDSQGKMDNYLNIRDKVNLDADRVFTAWFYGLSNIYLHTKFADENIVTDRHIVSNYAWSGKEENKDIYDLIIKKIGKPIITIILYSSKEVIEKRLKSRNMNDSDIAKLYMSEKIYSKMINFCETQKLDYIVIDSSNLSIEEVVNKILVELKIYGI